MEIRSRRLVLREFTSDDIPAVEAYHANPAYRRFLPWEEATHADAASIIAKCLAHVGESPRLTYQFAITLADSGTLIGSAGLKLNSHHPYEASFACELDPAHWGRGFGSETCHTLIDFGFGALNLHRIYSQVIAENRAAIRMIITVGMQREGLFRENRFFDGHWWDTLSYAIMSEDWKRTDRTEIPMTNTRFPHQKATPHPFTEKS